MKAIINRAWGSLPDYLNEHRTDPKVIAEVENGLYKVYAFEEPVIAVFPDEVTDWKIISYDGMESLIFVLNGKMYYTNGGEYFPLNKIIEGEIE